MHVSDQYAFPLHMPPNCLVKKELRTFMLVWHQTMAVTAQQYYKHVAFSVVFLFREDLLIQASFLS